MPLSPTPNMALVLPTPQADIGTWGDEENAAFTLIDAHDHSPGKGALVGVAGMNVNGDLTFAGNSATHLRSSDYDEVSSLATGARRIFWSSADHELYVRNASGVNIKITNGSTLNLSLVGGIVGDYASVGAEVAYDDANDRYTFKQQLSAGVKQWARLDGADVDIYEYKAAGDATNITNRVRLSSPAALAGSYTLTFPAALPGSTQLMQMSSAGAITASNTIANALTVAALTANGQVLCNDTLDVIGAAQTHGSLQASGGFIATSYVSVFAVISPAALTVNTDDWNPTGLATCNVIRIDATGAVALTGIVAQTGGRTILIVNIGSNAITLINDASSTAANRFKLPTDISIGAGGAVQIWYDATTQRWRAIFGRVS